jgi:hypothetical protein
MGPDGMEWSDRPQEQWVTGGPRCSFGQKKLWPVAHLWALRARRAIMLR